jgi:hypothetical protein
MFRGLINDAKAAATSVIGRYVARASVAIPFVIALAFAMAAITVMLVQRFGHVTVYWLMAAGLALIGAMAALVVSVKEQDEEVADQQAEAEDTAAVASEVVTQAPLALLGSMLASPGGATSALAVVRLLARNLPLVVLAVIVATLLWPSETDVPPDSGDVDLPDTDDAAPQPAMGKPNGFRPSEETHP